MMLAYGREVWLTSRRIRVYGLAFALFFSVVFGAQVRDSLWLRPGGQPLFLDFGVFFSMGREAVQGQAALTYLADSQGHFLPGFLEQITPVTFGWFYPPYFFLYLEPLSYLSPQQAFVAFMGFSILLYVSALVKIFPGTPTLAAVFGFSGFWINLIMGQNGFLSAGLAAWALLWLQHKPIRAGIMLGLLSFKPQLGLLFPLVLIIGREWRCFFSAAVTVALLTMASVWRYGFSSWLAWWSSLNRAQGFLLHGSVDYWMKIPSVLAWVRAIGGSIDMAYAAQALSAAAVLLALIWTWRSALSRPLKYTVLVLSSLMVSPYLFEYDLTWLALAGVWWAREVQLTGSHRIEQIMAVFLWGVPALMFLASRVSGVYFPIAQAGLLAAMAMLVWHGRRDIREMVHA
ncbi:MAG: DUF2029 domain-containing protein [Ferrovum sp.]|nr:DUF2029 domain-containing protein [Ferrovum sp.]NDU87088.1 DUF2029 domain-containing protein [Ferrovum sp.]